MTEKHDRCVVNVTGGNRPFAWKISHQTQWPHLSSPQLASARLTCTLNRVHSGSAASPPACLHWRRTSACATVTATDPADSYPVNCSVTLFSRLSGTQLSGGRGAVAAWNNDTLRCSRYKVFSWVCTALMSIRDCLFQSSNLTVFKVLSGC